MQRQDAGETYCGIGLSLRLSRDEVQGAVKRWLRKERKIAAGYIQLPKGRPCNDVDNEEARCNNEAVCTIIEDSGAAAPFSAIKRKDVSPKIKYAVSSIIATNSGMRYVLVLWCVQKWILCFSKTGQTECDATLLEWHRSRFNTPIEAFFCQKLFCSVRTFWGGSIHRS